MNKSPLQMEYPKEDFIQLLKVLHQELMQLKLTSYQNITEEMLRQLGHMERAFIALSHCVEKTPEWQNRSHEHERYNLKSEEYWNIKMSAQAAQFSARWSVVADILGNQTDMDAQENVLDAALTINEEIQKTLLEVWPEDRLPPKTIIFRDDKDWRELIERHRAIIEDYKWKLSSIADREQAKKVIINTINSTHERELRLLLLCVGVQYLRSQGGRFAPFDMSLCYRPPEPRLFEMIDRSIEATFEAVSDINGLKSWVAAERRKKSGFMFTNDVSVGRTIDRIVDAFEKADECCVCILHVEKLRIDTLATVISECLHLPKASIKRLLKRTYPAVITCQTSEQVDDLKKKIAKLCVCC